MAAPRSQRPTNGSESPIRSSTKSVRPQDFRTEGHGVFGTDVFLASVYAVYMYTTLRMRMTQEFNKIIPELAELVQRLLGVNRTPPMAEVCLMGVEISPKVDPGAVKEHEEFELEGVDISGHWNRMFEQRVIFDYDIEQLDKVTALDGGESMGYCYQCAQCVAVCPVDHVGDYGPRKLYRKLQVGMDFFTSDDLWLCTTCANCLRVCPKGGRHAPDHAGGPQGGGPRRTRTCRAPGRVRKDRRYGNPLGKNPKRRHAWTRKLDVEVPIISEVGRKVDVLWWVSDYPSYHPRGMEASRSLARVLAAPRC